MNRIALFLIFSFGLLSFTPVAILAQESTPDSTGLLGDHFSLEGALDLLKSAEDIEAFEKALNQENNSVNNLDLNEDGQIDYIRVVDHLEGDVHAIVLQALIGDKEAQDIAVIEVERTGEEEAMLQIYGDEVLYGEDYIVEPYDVAAEGGNGGPDAEYHFTRVVVNVWFWPSIRFIYRPAYRVYVSPFYWGYYPNWWRPWRPRPWRSFHARTIVFRPRYRVATTHRVVRARRIYTPRRTTSTVVVRRSRTTVRVTPRRTTVTRTTTTVGKRGNTTKARKKTTRTTTRKRGNTVTRKRTTKTKTKKRRRN